MARVFEQGLNNPRGFVLPVQRWNAPPRWRSERWQLRRSHLFLMPGDSPLGLRLPLDSLGYVPPDQYPYIVERDPMEARGKLPVFSLPARPDAPERLEPEQLNTSVPVRTAMSVEVRDGVLCAFMPPVEQIEDYLELIAALEATAEEMQLQVHVEGYPPPFDPRVDVIKVTPDPGVIEVNVQPAKNWREAVEITAGLYEDARQDTPRRQPLPGRRSPHRHRRRQSRRGRRLEPAGLAVPAPARSVEEPGAATGSVIRRCPISSPASSSARPARRRASTKPVTTASTSSRSRSPTCRRRAIRRRCGWWIGLFRHLLVDITGNTHRAEICIDKLYSPDGPTGRLGLVEFRALRNAAGSAHVAGAAAADPRADREILARAASRASSCAGAPRCTTASCCRTSSGRISSKCSPS